MVLANVALVLCCNILFIKSKNERRNKINRIIVPQYLSFFFNSASFSNGKHHVLSFLFLFGLLYLESSKISSKVFGNQ